jgi:hypothetical protein
MACAFSLFKRRSLRAYSTPPRSARPRSRARRALARRRVAGTVAVVAAPAGSRPQPRRAHAGQNRALLAGHFHIARRQKTWMRRAGQCPQPRPLPFAPRRFRSQFRRGSR